MPPDLSAGAQSRPVMLGQARRPVVLTFDSGLGGLTVLAELMRRLPGAHHVYLADDAGFPYGALGESAVVDRVVAVIDAAIRIHAPHLVVIACNTASTLVLPVLRDRFPIPFVGTVPAVKSAALASRTGCFAVLATPGTIARDYTTRLIESFAARASVRCVASSNLAAFAEAELRGSPVSDARIAAEIIPCFGRFVDTVVLACTHYPLLRGRLEHLAPWRVTWVDPAPAIASRVAALLPRPPAGPVETPHQAVFTCGTGLTPALEQALQRRGLGEIRTTEV